MAEIPRQDWRQLESEALHRGYNNAGAVGNVTEISANWQKWSADLRAKYPQSLDLRYGPRDRNRIDLIEAHVGAPLLVFVHGGWWQSRAKEDFTFVAEGPLAHGISVALVGYTLAPDATHDEMVIEVKSALDYLAHRGPLTLSGWSAGGHLAAMTLDHPAVKSGLAISGLYDLEPVRHTGFNAALGMNEAAAHRNSPIHRPLSDKRLDLAVGGAELPLMIGQTEDFAAARRSKPGAFQVLPGADHFTILDALRDPAGKLTSMVVDLVRA